MECLYTKLKRCTDRTQAALQVQALKQPAKQKNVDIIMTLNVLL
jgi:hypothetical protein